MMYLKHSKLMNSNLGYLRRGIAMSYQKLKQQEIRLLDSTVTVKMYTELIINL